MPFIFLVTELNENGKEATKLQRQKIGRMTASMEKKHEFKFFFTKENHGEKKGIQKREGKYHIQKYESKIESFFILPFYDLRSSNKLKINGSMKVNTPTKVSSFKRVPPRQGEREKSDSFFLNYIALHTGNLSAKPFIK